jgi:hypothetical protein
VIDVTARRTDEGEPRDLTLEELRDLADVLWSGVPSGAEVKLVVADGHLCGLRVVFEPKPATAPADF